jgi:Fe-S oxidoreductase
LRAEALEAALSNCLACKACTTECPSNVNMALLKADLLHARHRRHGLPWRERLVSAVDVVGRLGCLAPGLANACLQIPWLRQLLSRFLGVTTRRPLPQFAQERFDRWFARRPRPGPAPQGPVILWDDTFVRYYEPHIGRAAVAVLKAAGYEVLLPQHRQCCGRPAFSQGHLDKARSLGRHNLDLLTRRWPGLPILFLEPSCYSMFTEDYRELRLAGAEAVAGRSFLFEQFLEDRLSRDPEALRFMAEPAHLALHVHCHTKSLLNPGFMVSLLQRLPGREVTLLQTGCCGMAGAFGMVDAKYELSKQVAEPLLRQIVSQPAGTILAASGTSCRQQIEHLSSVHPKHSAVILAEALASF